MNPLLASNLDIAAGLAALALALLALPYVVLPLVIKFTFHSPANPSLQPVDVTQNPLPADVSNFFERIESELKPHGFELVGHYLSNMEFGNVAAIVMLLENRLSDDAALVLSVYGLVSGPGGTMLTARCVSFRRRFADGTELTTSNSDEPSVFAPVRHKKVFRFPQADNAATLFALHARAVREAGSSLPLPLPPRARMLDDLLAQMRSESAEQVETGYLRLDELSGKYHATWKGAYMMTWPNLWPIKKWQSKIRRRKAADLMKRWNFNAGPEPAVGMATNC